MKEITVRIHEIAVDGMPPEKEDGNLEDGLIGRLAFIFDGNVVSGWPLVDGQWEGDSDVARGGIFEGVTHWVEFPVPIWDLEKEAPRVEGVKQ